MEALECCSVILRAVRNSTGCARPAIAGRQSDAMACSDIVSGVSFPSCALAGPAHGDLHRPIDLARHFV